MFVLFYWTTRLFSMRISNKEIHTEIGQRIKVRSSEFEIANSVGTATAGSVQNHTDLNVKSVFNIAKKVEICDCSFFRVIVCIFMSLFKFDFIFFGGRLYSYTDLIVCWIQLLTCEE